MNKILGFLASAITAMTLAAPFSPALALGLSDRAGLQAAMQQHVDRQTVDGAYLYFDTKTSKVRALYPATAHPLIMEFGEQFVLCFDFADENGKKVEVDVYLARKGDSFIVFHTAVESRSLLMALMDAGKAKPAD